MSYVALYRKWRPVSFDEVKGQDAVVTSLKNQIISGRIGHAYLFCGSRGTGKTSVAKIFARAVNCENPRDGSPCGQCASCRAIEEGSSTNVIEIDAASNNGVDNIREIRDEVGYRPAEGRYRVYIVDEVHNLSGNAFNALLKTLEEPPEYVIFILATTEPHAILPTVVSRCQRFDFHRIGAEDIVRRLHELMEGEKVQADERALRYIARKADGALRDAISLFDQCVSSLSGERNLSYEAALKALGTVDNDILSRYLRALLLDDTDGALAVIEEVRSAGRELGQFVQDFIWYMRNLLLLMSADLPAELLEMSEEDWARLAEEGRMTDQDSLMRLIRLFSSLYNDLRGASDKRVLIEVATIKATRPAVGEEREALMSRLSRLERQVEQLKKTGIRIEAPAEKAETNEPLQAAAPAQKEAEVRIDKAKWDDLQLIKSHWNELLAEIDYQSAQLLKNVWLEPRDGGIMGLVFPDKFTANVAKGFGALDQLKTIVVRKLQKELKFDSRVAGLKEKAPVYISDEELAAIHMKIETEED